MKYDFVLAVLACGKDKYLDRLYAFVKNYGYKFTNKFNIKYKIVFLAGEQEPTDIDLKNIIDVEYDWCHMSEMTVANRFLNYIYNNPINYKWIFQVDDDSSTDIDRTYEILEDFYNHTDPLMFMSSRTTDLCMTQQIILRRMAIRNIFFGQDNIDDHQCPPMITHSHEASLLSSGAVQRIKLCNRTEEYLELSNRYRVYWTDNGTGVLSKICKIPIVESTFSDSWVDENRAMKHYSAIKPEGRLTHIHPILSHLSFYNDFITEFQKNKTTIFDTDFNDLDQQNTNNLWDFSGIIDNNINFYGVINLKSDGSIGIYNCDNEKFWEKSQDDATITFLDANRKPTCILSKISDNIYCGNFLLNTDIKHQIVRIAKL